MPKSAEALQPAKELAKYSLAELRSLRTELADYETRVSYWRRLVQARMDLAGQGKIPGDHQRLASVLADAPSRGRRIANLDLFPVDTTPPLPELDVIWQWSPRASEMDDYLRRLSRIEQDLSSHRRALHRQIDDLHNELIARYRENPALALTALP